MANKIRELFQESINVKQKVIESDAVEKLKHMAELTSNAIENGNKLLLCGNGGSAADAQHLAAEMLVRLRPSINREGVAAITLAQDTSTITACGNDFGYDELYKRTLQALGKKGDILIGITTSGNSENIIQAMQAAKDMDIIVFGFLGSGGGKALSLCNEAFVVPSDSTGRIQELHITAGHALMECIEDRLIASGYINLQG